MRTQRRPIHRYCRGALRDAEDCLVVEEPLEIWVDGSPFAVTMRVPGEDVDLVTGYCLTEAVVDGLDGLASVEPSPHPGGASRVLVTRATARDPGAGDGGARRAPPGPGLVRRCGVVLEGDDLREPAPVARRLRVSAGQIQACRSALEEAQRVFAETGATHAAALFDADGRWLSFAEDIGRHNALDKAIGSVARAGRLADARMAVLSSRLSHELVQKAAAVGLELLAGVSAATTSAAHLADRCGMTLVGFLRPGSMNLYTHPERVLPGPDSPPR